MKFPFMVEIFIFTFTMSNNLNWIIGMHYKKKLRNINSLEV